MSYILDALKKAEAERNVGAVPHLHVQPMTQTSVATTSAHWRSALIGLLILLLIGALGLLSWFQPWHRDSVYTVTVTTVAKPESGPPGMHAPAIMSAVASKPVAEKIAPAKPEPKMEKENPVGALQDMPEALKKELPQLIVNGYIYTENASGRSVLINNKLLREGEQVAPELRLEKMTPGGMVLNFRGYRYLTSY